MQDCNFIISKHWHCAISFECCSALELSESQCVVANLLLVIFKCCGETKLIIVSRVIFICCRISMHLRDIAATLQREFAAAERENVSAVQKEVQDLEQAAENAKCLNDTSEYSLSKPGAV